MVNDREYYKVWHTDGWLDDYDTHWLCLEDDEGLISNSEILIKIHRLVFIQASSSSDT